MPNVRAAEKAVRKSERARLRNLMRKGAIRQVIRQIRKHLGAGQKQEAQALLSHLAKAADKAAAHGAIHKNKAARIKARLMKLVAHA
ncbi:MAG: 30S ribosomal protein S20 [Candidatus Bipolaricaulota bacterium]|nr:30S ribosomal protein S20 [Candidatus Bipolaricaulota bacterium]